MIKKFFYENFFKRYFRKKLYMVGLAHILSIRKNYSEIKKLNDVDYKIFSQNGEDGIIDYLLTQLGIEKPKFLEIGVGDYSEANTRFIYEKSSAIGTIIDCERDLENKVKKNLDIWRGEISIIEKVVSSDNILEILNKNDSLFKLDLFSLDIDGVDYWILKKLPKDFSKIAIIEFNPLFGKDIEVTVPNINNFDRNKYHYSNLCFGMSIKAAINIMKEKNFYFVGTNLLRNNAFFISNRFKKDVFFKNLEINDLSSSVNATFSESRNKNKELNYLKYNERLKEILNCDIVDLKDGKNEIVKLEKLINLN